MYDYKSYKDVDLKGKKVLIRVDINSNIDTSGEKPKIRGESPRIKLIIPTLNELKDSAVVLIAHQGRPGGKDFTSLDIHAEQLRSFIPDRTVKYVEDIFGETAIDAIKQLKPGEILVLDNVRKFDLDTKSFKDFKEAQQTELIQKLAPLFDYFINDAFGAAHRSQPSIIGWPTLLAGPLIIKEFEYMEKIIERPEKPVAMLIGGAKAIGKYKAMKYNFENDRLDYALCSGLTAILIMEAIGMNMGSKNKDIISKDLEANKEDIIATYNKFKDKIILPKDLVIKENGGTKNISTEDAGKFNTITGDIGPETVKEFSDVIMKCKTIIANGPPGIFEDEVFRDGTKAMVKAMAEASEQNNALTVIGGGEMGLAAEMFGYGDKVSFISTGGGAMLELLSGKEVPLVKAFREKKP